MTLTAKQQRFVDEYLVDLNATKAAIRAGYSEKTAQEQGSRLLSNVIVQESINEKMKERSKRTQITADYVLNTIVETIERCKQEIKPIYEGRGENRQFTGEFQFDSMAVLKGAELLGKHLKLFTDKVEHAGPNGGPIKNSHELDTANLTTEQLRALAAIPIKT